MKKIDERSFSTRTIREIIGEITGNPVINKGIGEARAIKSWEKVVGSPVARLTTRVYLCKGDLHVIMNSSIVRNELMMNKEKIIEELNKEAGYRVVNNLILR